MGLSDTSKINISIKKLSGKAQTSNDKDLANEGLPTGLTLSAETIFGDQIPTSPNNSSHYTVTGEVAEYLRLSASFIPGTDTVSGRHAFALQLPDDYEASSSNPKKGAYPFLNKQVIYITSGSLQLIPTSFATGYEAKPYHTGSGETAIPVLDARDWNLDYFNGIFFQQDPPATGDSNQNPRYVDAFLYIGSSVKDKSDNNSGGDPNANYLVLSATGSLPNERIFTPGLGLSGTDAGAGGAYTVKIRDSIVATLTGSQFSGNVGITGSFGATQHSVFGKGVEINAEKGSAGGPGGNDLVYFGSTVGREIIAAQASTNQVKILSGGAASSPSENNYPDMAFFVSGSVGSKNTSTKGVSVFGGDQVISGALAINQSAAAGSQVFVTTQGRVGIGTSTPAYKLSVGGNMEVGEYIYHRNDSDTFIQFADDAIGITAGGEQLITISEAGQDIVKIGDGGDVDFQVRTLNDDNTLYVKGDTDTVGIGLNGPATKLHVKGESPTVRIQRDNQVETSTLDFAGAGGVPGASIAHAGLTNDLVFSVFNGSAVEEILRLGDHYSGDNRQVIFLSGSGMHAGAMNPRNTPDLSFFVSGAIGSKDTTVKGTSVFGGDLLTSGTFFAPSGISGSLTRLSDGSSYLVAGNGIVISSASNGSITVAAGVSSRLKFIKGIASTIASGDDCDTSADFSAASYSFNRIDIFVNGQLLASGSQNDYLLNTSKTGSIHFNFDLLKDDVVTSIINA